MEADRIAQKSSGDAVVGEGLVSSRSFTVIRFALAAFVYVGPGGA